MGGPEDTPEETSKPPLKLTRQIIWRLPVVMAERGIYKRNKLQMMLKDVGIELSTVQVGRIFNEPPDAFKKQLLEGLMTVLNCSLDELLHVVEVDPNGENTATGQMTSASKPKVSKPRIPEDRNPVEGRSVPQFRGAAAPSQDGSPSISKVIGPYDLKKGPKVGALPKPPPKTPTPEE